MLMNNTTPAEAREIKKLSRPLPGYWFYVVTMVLLIVLAVGGYFAYRLYGLEQGRKDIDLLAKAISEGEQQAEANRRADNIGGKTPQETLQMYISAVEKGDYELASKYLIFSNRDNEIRQLKALSAAKNINEYVSTIKRSESDTSASNSSSSFWMKSAYESGPDYMIEFTLYPSGVWKIAKI